MKKEFHYTEKEQPKAILVAVSTRSQSPQQTEEYLDELEFLAETLGVVTEKRFVQNLERPDARTFVGKGKLEQIQSYVDHHNIDMIIFDDDLTTPHVKNLDSHFAGRLVIDRSLLILQIFMKRAQTAQAKTQVELAQYQYMLPRLTNLWSHHSRQRGGIGMRGPGETELETDKRIIRDKIILLKNKLKKIENQNQLQRKTRNRMVRVALVGYTNVGKSTLMRLMAKADVFAEDKLFATVDSTVRKITWFNLPFLLTDTVGFIRKLPTTLIEAFKSTLNEVVEADILLHIIDISHDNFEEQIEVVNTILQEIGAADKPTILVFNKIDQFEDKEYPPFEENPPASIEEWKETYIAKESKTVFISAVQKENFEELRKMLFAEVERVYYDIYPNDKKYEYNQYWQYKEGQDNVEDAK